MVVEAGRPLSGLVWAGRFPQGDYDLELEAMRVAGRNAFCDMTFPVGEAQCAWAIGAHGGSTVGLMTIDGLGANRNETTKQMEFENGRWYRLRLRVTCG